MEPMSSTLRKESLCKPLLLWGSILALALTPLFFVPTSSLQANEATAAVHRVSQDAFAAIYLMGSILAFTVSYLTLSRFAALGSRRYLFMGLGFFVAAVENLLRGLLAQNPLEHTDIPFLLATHISARICTAIILFLAFVFTRERRSRDENRHRVIYRSLGFVTAVVGLMSLAITPLVDLATLHTAPTRLIDVALLALYCLALPFAVALYRKEPGGFESSLVACLILLVSSQFYFCRSQYFFDPPSVVAQSLNLGSYLAPVFGLSYSLIAKHQELEAQRHRLSNQTALLWQQSQGVMKSNKILAQQAEDLAQLSELKSQFVANMSHELRTPLNAVIGFSDSLLHTDDEDRLNEWQTEYVSKIKLSGERLLALINDILDLSKIEAGKDVVHPCHFSAGESVSSTVSLLEPLFSKKPNVRLEITVADNLEPVYLDRDKLGQIVTNLVGNACKFTTHGVVSVGVHQAEGKLYLTVTDTGIGIAPEHQRSIFEPFRQVDGRSSRQAGGTGLGLALVKRVAELMQGSVSVESAIGAGSTFRVELPVRFSEPPERDDAARDDAARGDRLSRDRHDPGAVTTAKNHETSCTS